MRAFCSMFGITLLLSFAFASASTAQAGGETAWKVSALGGGQQMASIRTSGPSEPKRGMALTCQGKAPMLVIPTTRIGIKPRGNLAMTGTTGGTPVAVSMIWDPQGSAWVASMSDRAALDLLAGASTSVSLTLDGTALGTIPLTGSSNAIRTALAGCYVPVASMARAGPWPAGTITLVSGYYVSGAMKCSDIPWNDGYFTTAEDDVSLLYLQEGEVFDKKDHPKRRITSSTSFVDGAWKYNHCADSVLNPDSRRWPDSRHKPVSGLPIKPGLYRTYRNGKLIPQAERCSFAAEYFLFEPARVAMVAEEYILDRNGYPTSKFQRVRKVLPLGKHLHQIATRVYANAFVENDTSEVFGIGPWLIEAPDRFTLSEGECDQIQFRPVDPRPVPASLMPRF